MPRYNIFKSKFFCLIVKAVKFKISVASDARIGRLTVFVAADERLNDFLSKLCFIMINIVRNTYLLTDRSRILSILEAAAGSEKILTYNIIFIKSHSASHALISSVMDN